MSGTGKLPSLTITVSSTNVIFVVIGASLGYYFARRRYAYLGEED